MCLKRKYIMLFWGQYFLNVSQVNLFYHVLQLLSTFISCRQVTDYFSNFLLIIERRVLQSPTTIVNLPLYFSRQFLPFILKCCYYAHTLKNITPSVGNVAG